MDIKKQLTTILQNEVVDTYCPERQNLNKLKRGENISIEKADLILKKLGIKVEIKVKKK